MLTASKGKIQGKKRPRFSIPADRGILLKSLLEDDLPWHKSCDTLQQMAELLRDREFKGKRRPGQEV